MLRCYLWAVLSLSPVLGAAPLLQLNPVGGALTGVPNATVGWGFTITNTTNYMEVTGSDFCEGAIVSPCPHTIGNYTDFIGAFNFIVVGPAPESPSVTQAFNLPALTGVGSFHINSTSNAGDVAAGQIVITYDLFSRSPDAVNFNPLTDTLSTGNSLTAAARVTVTGPTTVPELASLGMAGLALIGMAVLKHRTLSGYKKGPERQICSLLNRD